MSVKHLAGKLGKANGRASLRGMFYSLYLKEIPKDYDALFGLISADSISHVSRVNV